MLLRELYEALGLRPVSVSVIMIMIVIVIAAGVLVLELRLKLGLSLRDFFLAGRPDVGHIHLEPDPLARKWVVGVDDEGVRKDLDDPHRHRLTVGRLSEELIARLNIVAIWEVALVDLENTCLIALTEGLLGLDDD